jgi:hypothetical protein
VIVVEVGVDDQVDVAWSEARRLKGVFHGKRF